MRFEFRHVPIVLERVAACGARTDDLLAEVGLPADAAERPVVVGSVERIEALLAEAGRRTGSPSFGLELTAHVPRGRLGWYEYAVRTAGTVDAALAVLARYGAMLNRDAGYSYALRDDDRMLTFETPQRVGGLGPHLNEFTIGLLLRRATETIGEEFRAQRVWFAHGRPTSEVVERMLGCPVHCGQTTSGLGISAAQGGVTMRTRDPELHALILGRLDELMPRAESTRSTSARVRSAILERLGNGSLELGDVATVLGTSARTLQRELADEGTSFAALLSDARRGLAESLLQREDLTIGEIAGLLGYADLRGFDRAYRRWTGASPIERRGRKPEPSEP